MNRSPETPDGSEGFPPPLTPERVERALERVATIHERLRRKGIDFARLPDPVDILIKARDADGRE